MRFDGVRARMSRAFLLCLMRGQVWRGACLPVLKLEQCEGIVFCSPFVKKVRALNIEIEICYNEENLKDKNAICIVTMC